MGKKVVAVLRPVPEVHAMVQELWERLGQDTRAKRILIALAEKGRQESRVMQSGGFLEYIAALAPHKNNRSAPIRLYIRREEYPELAKLWDSLPTAMKGDALLWLISSGYSETEETGIGLSAVLPERRKERPGEGSESADSGSRGASEAPSRVGQPSSEGQWNPEEAEEAKGDQPSMGTPPAQEEGVAEDAPLGGEGDGHPDEEVIVSDATPAGQSDDAGETQDGSEEEREDQPRAPEKPLLGGMNGLLDEPDLG